MQPTVTLTKGGSAKAFAEGLKNISKLEVLVGVPAEKASRKGDKINNAEIMYIQTNGSPLRGIPARPVIEPAIEDDKQAISAELSEAAKSMLDGKRDETIRHLKRAGMEGANAARAWFVSAKNNWAPNAPSTIRRKGSDKPLIDTSEMRKSITFVVKAE